MFVSDFGEIIIFDVASVAVGVSARFDEVAYCVVCDVFLVLEEFEIVFKCNVVSDFELIDYINEYKGGGGNV